MDELLRFAALYVSKDEIKRVDADATASELPVQDCSPGWDSTVHKVEPLGHWYWSGISKLMLTNSERQILTQWFQFLR